MTRPEPPSHLTERTRQIWLSTVQAYELEPHHLAILQSACEALDRQEEARLVLEAEGLFSQNRYGSKIAHPAIAVERDSRASASKLIRELGLDVEPPKETRLPRIGG